MVLVLLFGDGEVVFVGGGGVVGVGVGVFECVIVVVEWW